MQYSLIKVVGNSYVGYIFVLVAWVLWAVIYMLPTIILAFKGTKKNSKVILLNILTGWTVIGWIVALFWSFRHKSPKESIK